MEYYSVYNQGPVEQPLEPKSNKYKELLYSESSLIPHEKFYETVNKGLPEMYNSKNWWEEKVGKLITCFDKDLFEKLSVELKKEGPIKNDGTVIEAVSILQAIQEGLIGQPSRPDMENSEIEHDRNFDFRVLEWDKNTFLNLGLKPVYVDIKTPLDPETILARGENPESIEDCVNNLLRKIEFQRARAHKYNSDVIHIITLLRIKPSNRTYFINNFKAKALDKNINFNGVRFINTSPDTI